MSPSGGGATAVMLTQQYSMFQRSKVQNTSFAESVYDYYKCCEIHSVSVGTNCHFYPLNKKCVLIRCERAFKSFTLTLIFNQIYLQNDHLEKAHTLIFVYTSPQNFPDQ